MTVLATLAAALAAGGAEVTVNVSVAPGLKYNPARFAVAPGDQVRVVFHNGDEMIHNFVVTAPGSRLKVVSAALELGANGPGRNFVPDLGEVLWSAPALNPGETATLAFTAPSKEGVYPYVCTFPGHGFVMYGAMYVTRGELPAAETDPNIPPVVAAAAELKDGLLTVGDNPVVSRTFLPDCGPAAVAVGLPGGQSYCFDAGACRLRYAWKGGFVDNTEQWAGKGEIWSRVVGRVYYRAPAAPWLRVGAQDRVAEPRWRGYRLVRGYPQFLYEVDGTQVRELIRPRPGGGGLEIAYEIPSAPGPVYFVFDREGGAAFGSSAGTWSGSVLTLAPGEASSFMITLTERPGVEPLGYWSMNDPIWGAEKDPKPGVVGRAFTPGGLEETPHVLDSGVAASELAGGATLMAWVKTGANGTPGPIFSAGPSFVVPSQVQDDRWHHVALTLDKGGEGARLYVDGSDRGASGLRLPAANARVEIGSAGGRFLSGLLDEVRIFDRVLPGSEIAATYRREAALGNLPTQ
jgi:plastocyanin